jgi:hypothetical protein
MTDAERSVAEAVIRAYRALDRDFDDDDRREGGDDDGHKTEPAQPLARRRGQLQLFR